LLHILASSVVVSILSSALLDGTVATANVATDDEAEQKRHEYIINCLKEKMRFYQIDCVV
jgi:hypothetical protein